MVGPGLGSGHVECRAAGSRRRVRAGRRRLPAHFADPGEDAAALAVFHDGRRVVDLWGGADVVNQRPMPADGLMMVASCSKGITATVLAVLVERGVLDPEEAGRGLLAEFAAAGKEDVTARHGRRRTPPACRTRRWAPA